MKVIATTCKCGTELFLNNFDYFESKQLRGLALLFNNDTTKKSPSKRKGNPSEDEY